jgi:hypothetical protein
LRRERGIDQAPTLVKKAFLGKIDNIIGSKEEKRVEF